MINVCVHFFVEILFTSKYLVSDLQRKIFGGGRGGCDGMGGVVVVFGREAWTF